MQSLLQGLPLQTQSYTYSQPSQLSNILAGGGIADVIASLLGRSAGKKDDKSDIDEAIDYAAGLLDEGDS